MVKRQKEKLYVSNEEQKIFGSSSGSSASRRPPQALPFAHCALTLLPYTTPTLLAGARTIFDYNALADFIVQHKKDPVTGKPASLADIVKLFMEKDDDGRWQDPIVQKTFSNRSKVVAVLTKDKKSAHVYSYDTYKELNLKAKSYFDLTTGEAFSPKTDVLVLYDPDDVTLMQQRNVSNFWYVKEGKSKSATSASGGDIQHSRTASRVLKKLSRSTAPSTDTSHLMTSRTMKFKTEQKEYDFEVLSHDVTGVQLTTKQTSSLTSTALTAHAQSTVRPATREEILQARFHVMRNLKKKGLINLETSLGALTLALDCDRAPRTCTNFLGLCARGSYRNTEFHRLIRGFMIQGGQSLDGEDESLWGEAFPDEFDPSLTHSGRGVLSMANAGSHTNRQQFFITFKACSHLDRKHSVFGRIVDGGDVLDAMEQVATDSKDRPRDPIVILETKVLVDPAEEAKEKERVRLLALAEERAAHANGPANASKKPSSNAESSLEVGKYVIKKIQKRAATSSSEQAVAMSQLPPPPKRTKFGNFDGW